MIHAEKVMKPANYFLSIDQASGFQLSFYKGAVHSPKLL